MLPVAITMMVLDKAMEWRKLSFVFTNSTLHTLGCIFTQILSHLYIALRYKSTLHIMQILLWWTDIPTTYRASQLSIELSLSVQVCPHLSSRTQDVSVLYWFAFSPTLNLPYPTIKHQAVWLYTWLCISNHFKLNYNQKLSKLTRAFNQQTNCIFWIYPGCCTRNGTM